MSDVIAQHTGEQLFKKLLDLDSETTIFASIHTTALTVTSTDLFWSDVSSTEVTSVGGNYISPSGILQTSTSISRSGAITTWDVPDISVTGVTFVAGSVTFYEGRTTPELSPIIAQYDFGGGQTVNGGTFTIEIDSAGLLTIA